VRRVGTVRALMRLCRGRPLQDTPHQPGVQHVFKNVTPWDDCDQRWKKCFTTGEDGPVSLTWPRG
jgi:hypothetical protein